MINKLILIGILILFLPSCTSYYSGKAAALETGAKVADEALANAELVQCRIISIGAWMRRYGQNRELTAAWNTICIGQPIELPQEKDTLD